MTHPKVSIILLTKNAEDEISTLLDRIRSQAYPGDTELIVIDSGSTDGTTEKIREYDAEVYQIEPEEFHHSQTRNFGAERASGEIIVYLVQDALPRDSNWLTALVSPIVNGDASVVYGRQIAYPDAKPMDRFFYSYFYPDSRVEIDARDVADKNAFYLEHVYISDVTSAISSEVWDAIRFDDDVDMSEDKDFAFRAVERGETVVYEPEAAVYHSHYYDLNSLFARRFNDGRAFAHITGGTDSGSFLKRGVRYFTSELEFMWTERKFHWIPYAILYDLVYYISFNAGQFYGTYVEKRRFDSK